MMAACQRRRRMRWKSTLAKVTKSVRKMLTGSSASHSGPSTAAADASAVTRAKSRYITVPVAMATGSVQFLMKAMQRLTC